MLTVQSISPLMHSNGIRGTVVGDDRNLPCEGPQRARLNNAESHAVVGRENAFDIIPKRVSIVDIMSLAFEVLQSASCQSSSLISGFSFSLCINPALRSIAGTLEAMPPADNPAFFTHRVKLHLRTVAPVRNQTS